jgi:hypothetical protein
MAVGELPVHNPQRVIGEDERGIDATALVRVLDFYKQQAKSARNSGSNPRDVVWEANWNRYWGRYDTSDKAEWQSKHVMPESPQFVDRWAAAMREALDAARSDRTVVVVAHRLSTILSADRVVVLDRGRVVGDGTHPDLLRECPEYARLVAAQWSLDLPVPAPQPCQRR